jgi:hypothetical protein
MTDINTLMDAPVRTTYCKFDFLYSDATIDNSIMASSVHDNYASHPTQVIDGIRNTSMKWFTLHDNKLDETYHPLPYDNSYQVGWWGNALSDIDGAFSIPQELIVEFNARQMEAVEIIGDTFNNIFPVNFTVRLYVGDALHTTITKVDNTEQVWYNRLDQVIVGVTKIVVSVTKINKPNYTARITEFFIPIKRTYINSDIMSVSLLEELEYAGQSVQLGSISSNEIDIILNNVSHEFDPNNVNSSLYGYLKKGRRIIGYLGVEDVDGSIIWTNLGTYWTTSWKISNDSLTVGITARDILEILRTTKYNGSVVYTNRSLYDLFDIVFTDFGFTKEEYVIDTTLKNIIIPYAWFGRNGYRDILYKLASCALVFVFVNRLGQVEISSLTNLGSTTYDFHDAKSIYSSYYPLAFTDIANSIYVKIYNYAVGNQQTILNDTSILSIPAGQNVIKSYEFTNVPVYELISLNITKDSDLLTYTHEMYNWGIIVTYTNTDVVTRNISVVSAIGKVLTQDALAVVNTKDNILIRDDGEISITIDNPFIQDNTYATSLASQLLEVSKDSKYNAVLNCRGHIGLQPSDVITINESIDNYVIVRQQTNWNGALSATVECKKL